MRLGAGALALALPLALAGCGGDAGGAAAAQASAAKCPSAWLDREIGGGSDVELLVAAGDTIPANRWAAYRAMATAVAACASPGSALTLRPITAVSLTELPIFSGTVPAPTGQNAVNPLRYHADVIGFGRRAAAAVDRLPALARNVRGSDPLGAFSAAGQNLRIGATGSKHVVVAIFNGWQQSRALNLFSYRRDPASLTTAAVGSLRASGALPDLSGSDVVIAGLTPGDASMQTSDAQLAGLCRFWRGVVTAGGGNLKLCVAALPGIGDRG